MGVIKGVIIIVISGIFVGVLDIHYHIDKPVLYWLLGALSGLIALAIGLKDIMKITPPPHLVK